MNKERRKIIAQVGIQLELMQAAHEKAKELLELAKEGEQDAYENMPMSLQTSEKGQQIETNADGLQEALDALEELDIGDIPQQLKDLCAVA